MSVEPLRFEALSVGACYVHGDVAIDAASIKRFARRYDPQPFHLDEKAGRASLFGGLAAPGWLSMTLVARQLTAGAPQRFADVGAEGLDDLRWRRPVLAGDRLSVSSTCLALDARRGAAQLRVEAVNRAGELALQYTTWIFVARRLPAALER
ncbi:MAG TPA: MaoC/PaaZ C-terminal domain-containing protein [Nevskiaceae bacterium]